MKHQYPDKSSKNKDKSDDEEMLRRQKESPENKPQGKNPKIKKFNAEIRKKP